LEAPGYDHNLWTILCYGLDPDRCSNHVQAHLCPQKLRNKGAFPEVPPLLFGLIDF
jgi:hypothetical protein